jgi:hypothetical protein
MRHAQLHIVEQEQAVAPVRINNLSGHWHRRSAARKQGTAMS